MDDFVHTRKNGKFNFKTTIVHDGIELARPSPKIPRKSRDSCYKVARSKARSAIRNRGQYEDEYDEDNPKTEWGEDKPSIIDYLEYCAYVIDYNGSCDLSYTQYCYLLQPPAKPYSPPQIRPETNVVHWPKRCKLINNKLSYAQVAR